MQICPFCASENIFFSKKRNKYYCEDCEQGFETPAVAKGMRVFLSYGHDKNAEVVKKIKAYLAARGYDVWIDTSEIAAGKDWRERITNGLIGSNGVISFLTKHSVRDPGVCLDELKIAVCLKHAYIQTVLLESEHEVEPPGIVRGKQWIDMSDWSCVAEADWEAYFDGKMALLVDALSNDDAVRFNEQLEFLGRKLGVNDNTVKQQRLLKNALVGRLWLTEAVDAWLRSSSRAPFMIFGVPGAGKSAFAANLAQFNPDVMASLFFEWDHGEHRNADSVVKYLAYKLAASLPDYRRMLCAMYAEHADEENMKQYHGASLFDQLILNPLHCCIDGDRRKGMIILDGLDEATPEISELLIQKAAYLPGWIKVLFTSRYEETMASRFEAANTVLLDHTHTSNHTDIRDYLSYRLGSVAPAVLGRLAQKSEGSFLYAVSFCNAVEEGSMTLEDAGSVPAGLNSFFYSFFKRLFATREAYLEVRPFLELLCVAEDVPEEVISDCLGLDRYGLWELRLSVKSLVTGAQSRCGLEINHRFKTIRFVHQSIKEWLTEAKLAGEFYIEASRGYRQIARYSERLMACREPEKKAASLSQLTKRLCSLDPKQINEELVKEIQAQMEQQRIELEAAAKKEAHRKALRAFAAGSYIKWLILGDECEKAKAKLLASFDFDTMKKNFDALRYTEYYRFFELWQWADLFPADYPMAELVEKLTQIVLYPKGYMVSHYAHRSMQISLLLLRYVMDSGRFAPALFALMGSGGPAGYFTSRASDDGETRDGWDKYYMARDAAICLKKLDKAGVCVPAQVRRACQLIKLTYNFENGDPFGGMFYGDGNGYWKYGILSETELFKDLCILETLEEKVGLTTLLPRLIHYNTLSLSFYLAHSDEEDRAFVAQAVEHHADLAEACAMAADALKKAAEEGSQAVNITNRLAFIRTLQLQ